MLTITFWGCKKSDQEDIFTYDCKIKWTEYDANDEEISWNEDYYLDCTGNLLNYSVYFYTDGILAELRNYLPESELNHYWMIENTCGIAYKNDLLKDTKYPTFVHVNQKKNNYEIIP